MRVGKPVLVEEDAVAPPAATATGAATTTSGWLDVAREVIA